MRTIKVIIYIGSFRRKSVLQSLVQNVPRAPSVIYNIIYIYILWNVFVRPIYTFSGNKLTSLDPRWMCVWDSSRDVLWFCCSRVPPIYADIKLRFEKVPSLGYLYPRNRVLWARQFSRTENIMHFYRGKNLKSHFFKRFKSFVHGTGE